MYMGRYIDSQLNNAKELPSEWADALTNILNATYETRSNKDNCFFDVIGKVFEKETILYVSYLNKEDYSASPITLSISFDNINDSKTIKKILDTSVSLTSLIFDDIFSNDDWNDYVLNWTENDIDNYKLFYKITRENMNLTLQAEELLKGNLD